MAGFCFCGVVVAESSLAKRRVGVLALWLRRSCLEGGSLLLDVSRDCFPAASERRVDNLV